jgi:hypothetical protein
MKRAAVCAVLALVSLAQKASADDAPSVRVHIESPEPTFLQSMAPGEDAWVEACVSPCDRELPTTARYRLVGPGVEKEITLVARREGSFDIVVKKPSRTTTTLGMGFTTAGALTALVGLVLAATGDRHAHLDCTHPPTGAYATRPQCDSDKESGPSMRSAGFVTLGVGAVVTAVGVFLVLRGKAKTEITERAPEPDVVMRRSEPPRAPTMQAAAPATFPILLQGSF